MAIGHDSVESSGQMDKGPEQERVSHWGGETTNTNGVVGNNEGLADKRGGGQSDDGDDKGEDANEFSVTRTGDSVPHWGGTAGKRPGKYRTKDPNNWPVHSFSLF